MSLKEEIISRRSKIKTDSYPMSIGEIANIYKAGELEIHPEFQRIFRWTSSQKTRFIESILIGIPIPPIFVSQRSDGVWDVVDGLQRLSTIFQLMGIAKDEKYELLEPLVLEKTVYLPSLEGKMWCDSRSEKNSLSQTEQIQIKRTKLGVNIILEESDEQGKYELFQRLNTGGSVLSEQEVRNCMLLWVNPKMFEWLKQLGEYQDFKDCITLTDRLYDQKYDLDLILRFIIFRKIKDFKLKLNDIGEFLTSEMMRIARDKEFDFENEGKAFKFTFEVLSKYLGEDSFKRYSFKNKRFEGGFLISAYEVVALGVGFNYEKIKDKKSFGNLSEIVRELWKKEEFKKYSGSGVRASSRIPMLIPMGRKLFK